MKVGVSGLRARRASLRVFLVLAITLGLASVATTSTAATKNAGASFDVNKPLIVAHLLMGSSFDPDQATSSADIQVFPLYDGLIQNTAKGELVPGLATSWDYSADGKSFTLKIRNDAKFQDGTPVTADAVVATLNRARGAKSLLASSLTAITNVTAVDASTVKLDLSNPDASIPGLLARNAGLVINPKFIDNDAALAAGTTGVGSGPYTVTSFVPKSKAVYDRSESYWNKSVLKQAPKHVEISLVSDASARLNGLKSGAFSAVWSSAIPGDLTALAASDKSFGYEPFAGQNIIGLFLRSDVAPFDKIEVRQAIAYALDVPGFVGSVLTYDGQPMPQIFGKGSWATDPSIKFRKRNVTKAKALLAKAGLQNGFTFDLGYATGTSSEKIATAVQAQLADVGITVNLKGSTQALADAGFNNGQYVAEAGTIAGAPDPAVRLSTQVLTRPFVPNTPEGDQYRKLAAQANNSKLTQDQRAALYRQMAQIMFEQAWVQPFMQSTYGFGHEADLQGMNEQSLIPFFGVDPSQVGFRASPK